MSSAKKTVCNQCGGEKSFDCTGRLRCLACRNLATANHRRKKKGLPPVPAGKPKEPQQPSWMDKYLPDDPVVKAVKDFKRAAKR